MYSTSKYLAATSVAFALLFCSAAAHAKTYVYKHTDGTVWHTNLSPKKVDEVEYKLIGVVNTQAPKPSKKQKKQADKKPHIIACGSAGDSSAQAKSAPYETMIDKLAQEHLISKHLIMAVVATESCFDEKAVSPAGAKGLMQLMPITAKELGVKDPFNSEENLRGGVQYLGKLSKRFNYNPKLTLAAYNAGPGNVEKYRGIPPFPETQAYVEKVMQAFLRYLQGATS